MPNKVASAVVTTAHEAPWYHGDTEDSRHGALLGGGGTVSPQDRASGCHRFWSSGLLVCQRGGAQPRASLPYTCFRTNTLHGRTPSHPS